MVSVANWFSLFVTASQKVYTNTRAHQTYSTPTIVCSNTKIDEYCQKTPRVMWYTRSAVSVCASVEWFGILTFRPFHSSARFNHPTTHMSVDNIWFVFSPIFSKQHKTNRCAFCITLHRTAFYLGFPLNWGNFLLKLTQFHSYPCACYAQCNTLKQSFVAHIWNGQIVWNVLVRCIITAISVCGLTLIKWNDDSLWCMHLIGHC